MVDRQCHHPTTEVEVAQVIWVNIGVAVRLKSCPISRLDEQCIVRIKHLRRQLVKPLLQYAHTLNINAYSISCHQWLPTP